MPMMTGAESDPGRLISHGIHQWLAAEAQGSSQGNNAVLDDLEMARTSLTLPFDDPKNQHTAKWQSHFDRQQAVFAPAVLENPLDDYAAARPLFNVLMQMSGCFRLIAVVQASDQDDYFKIKHSANPMGIDLGKHVRKRIHGLNASSEAEPSEDQPSGLEIALQGIEDAFEDVKGTKEQIRIRAVAEPNDFGRLVSASVHHLNVLQKHLADVAVDYIAATAELRDGDVARVPLLHPVSISEQPQDRTEAVIYPFVPDWEYQAPTA